MNRIHHDESVYKSTVIKEFINLFLNLMGIITPHTFLTQIQGVIK